MNDKWLQWASQLQSIAQAGLTFSADRYDLDRYEKLRNIVVEILHEYTDVDSKKVRELFASETGYQTPKIDIRASVFKENKILMVKEKIDGAWSLPGGWADVNTSVSESAIRECLEEAGAVVKPKRIVAIHLGNKHNNPLFPYTIYKIFIECELIENSFKENTETLEAGFFEPDKLPELSFHRNTPDQIKMCFEAKNCKVFETIFD
ncbi:MAG: NUDIX hydrolase [Bacteroidales bacterium]|jgi:ADP-ribose pyrophosphatase YjhB (NUDIX family)